MKRRILSLGLCLALALSLLPLSGLAASAEDYKELLSNFNTSAVQNDPAYYPVITVKSDTRIDVVTTYHWNNGKGAAPGSIIIEEDDQVMGTWPATGRSSSGVANTLWDAFPGVTFRAGHAYTIRDTGESTWSWNEGSRGAGFFSLRGGTSSAGSQSSGSSVNGYTCSDWAKAEVSKADSYGLIPPSLSGGDLREPINRADFAAVSLRTYQKMTGTTVPAASANPFSDTKDAEILKAYSLGIVNGMSATTFEPARSLTREQASTMLTRAYKKIVLPGWTLAADSSFQLQYAQPSPFTDQGKISAYAKDSVAFMASKGILKGMGDGSFAPASSVTREQALAIAVRMADGLDTTPQPVTPVVTPTGGSEGPAQGTLSTGDFSVTFKTAQGGQAVLVQDGKGYDLLLTDEATGTVEVSFPAAAPTNGTENVVYLGIPCLDANGKKDFEIFPLDTTYSGGKVTATADLSQYANAIEEAAYDTQTATGKTDYSAAFAKEQAAAVGSGVKVKIAVYFFCETEYLITSDAGHFRIYIPKSNYTTQSGTANGKINKEDGKRIVEDLENILSFYQSLYKIKRTDWPMKVVSHSGEDDGQYGSGRMKLKLSGLSNGYGRDLASSQKLYETMAHEMFHFVQREYTPVALSQSWFDEAAASYYGIQFGYQRCGSMDTAMKNENYSADAEAQYQGITPMDVSTLGWFDFLHAGYGRASFIDYLMKYHGTDFLKRYYEQGVTLAGLQTEARLENLTGKSLGELAEGFYDKLVLEKDSVNGLLNIPSDIFERKYSAGGDEGDASLDEVRTTWTLTGDNESTTIKVPRYGAYFTALDMEKAALKAKTFTLTVPTADCAARLIAIHNNSTESQYTLQKVYKPDADGRFQTLPLDGAMYLLMMVNTTGSWGWTVSERLDITYDKLSTSGSYPSSYNEVPVSFSGTLGLWKGGAEATHTGGITGATLEVESDGSFLIFTLQSSQLSNPVYASGRGFFNSSGQIRCTTSDGTDFLVQLSAGDLVDRTKGPQPTEEQKEEMATSPFGLVIEGEKATTEVRVVFKDRFGRLNVFGGSGVNDNSFSYFPEIHLP